MALFWNFAQPCLLALKLSIELSLEFAAKSVKERHTNTERERERERELYVSLIEWNQDCRILELIKCP